MLHDLYGGYIQGSTWAPAIAKAAIMARLSHKLR